MDEAMPLASRHMGKASTKRLRGLPVTGPSFRQHPLSAPVCVEGKVMNAAEVPACRELTVKGTMAGRGTGSDQTTGTAYCDES